MTREPPRVVTPDRRSCAVAALAVLVGVGSLVATYHFVSGLSEPPPGSDGFAHGLAAAGAILFAIAGLAVTADGVAVAVLAAVGATTRQRLLAAVGATVAAVGPPLVVAWVEFDVPVEASGVGLLAVLIGTLVVGVAVAWVAAAALLDALREGHPA
jgi:hypothetical protein